jgi:hypothetical protein
MTDEEREEFWSQTADFMRALRKDWPKALKPEAREQYDEDLRKAIEIGDWLLGK